MDDVNGVFNVLEPGTEFKNDQLTISEAKKKEDEGVDADKRTMDVIKDVAYSIDEMIQMTIDVPSNYKDRRVPMLDTKVWLNEEDENKIYYIFHQKEMRNRLVILKKSALAMKQKMSILSQETFRRLHNTKFEVENETKVDILNSFMADLKSSSYDEKETYNTERREKGIQ